MIEKELKERISLEEQLKVGRGNVCLMQDLSSNCQYVFFDWTFDFSRWFTYFKEANAVSPFNKFWGFVFCCCRCLIGCKIPKFSLPALQYHCVCLSQGARGREAFRAAVTWHGTAVSLAKSEDDPRCINFGWIHQTSRSSRILTLEYFWPCRPVGYTNNVFW